MAAFLSESGIEPHGILEDPEGALAATFDISAAPTTFIVDGSGRISFRLEGWSLRRWDQFMEIVDSLEGSGGEGSCTP